MEPLLEREVKFAISWPNVVRVEHEFRPRLTLDLDMVDTLTIRASNTPTMAQLGMVNAGKPDLTGLTDIVLDVGLFIQHRRSVKHHGQGFPDCCVRLRVDSSA